DGDLTRESVRHEGVRVGAVLGHDDGGLPTGRRDERSSLRGVRPVDLTHGQHAGSLEWTSVKVLVIGSGAREHALVTALSADPQVDAAIVAPGNPGMAAVARCEPVDPLDPSAVTELARAHAADLVVIGPEAPLVAGVADAVREAGIACYGPSAEGARLEGSKAFAKEVMAAADVPTGMGRLCTTLEEVEDALDAFGAPHVVKDDGLAAGKGVVVTDDQEAALAHAQTCLAKDGGAVVIEEFLDGP